jgi:hypothetical protein
MSKNPKEEVSNIMGRLIKGTDTPAEEREEERSSKE